MLIDYVTLLELNKEETQAINRRNKKYSRVCQHT